MKRTLCALAVLAAGLCACQRNRDRAVEGIVEQAIAARGRESHVSIDREHGSITVDLGGAMKPAGWPAAVPIYPNSHRAEIAEATSPARHLSVLTEDSAKEMNEFYRAQLASDGWQLDTLADHSLRARRGGERLELRFTTRGKGKGSRADIQYDPAAPG